MQTLIPLHATITLAATILVALAIILLIATTTRSAVGTWRAMSAGAKSPCAPTSLAPEPMPILRLGRKQFLLKKSPRLSLHVSKKRSSVSLHVFSPNCLTQPHVVIGPRRLRRNCEAIACRILAHVGCKSVRDASGKNTDRNAFFPQNGLILKKLNLSRTRRMDAPTSSPRAPTSLAPESRFFPKTANTEKIPLKNPTALVADI